MMSQANSRAKDREIARLVARISMEQFLRTAYGLTKMLPGQDFTLMIVHRAIVTANLAHLDVDSSQRVFSTLEQAPPDEIRRPVSVRAVAASLDLPFETVRRRVEHLIELGHCKRVKGGVIVPAAALEGSGSERALLANISNIRRLYHRLNLIGFDFSGDEQSAETA